MDAMMRRRMMMGLRSAPTPPVTRAYIRNTDLGAYIDTGIVSDSTTKVIVWARNFNPTCGFLFGSRTSAGVDSLGLGTHTAESTGSIRVDYAQTNNTYYNNAFQYLSNYHKYELYNGVLKVDDITLATATQDTFSNSYNIHLFGINNGGSHIDAVLPIDICACQIYKNDVLVRDYTAVNSPSAGLYDAVSETLFTNAGSGSFTYGEFNKNAYTPLEYIECNQDQYFDTGAYGSYADGVVCKFRSTNQTPRLYEVLVADNNKSTPSVLRFTLGASNVLNNRMYFVLGTSNTTFTLYNNTNPRLTNLDVIAVKETNNQTAKAYINGSQIGSVTASAASDFVTETTINVGAGAYGNDSGRRFTGRYYYVGIGSSRSLVPAQVGTRVGMYDTYNDIFYSSISGTNFTAGNEI
jgi:hypothetical protein